MPYVIQCDREGLLPMEFDSADAASDWLDEQEPETVTAWAEIMLTVYRANNWSAYPDAEIYPYMLDIMNADDPAQGAIDAARDYYLQARMIRYKSWATLTPSR